MLEIFETQEAFNDIIEIGEYIAGRAGLPVSYRLIDKIRSTYVLLATYPEMGHLREFDDRYPGLRSFPISQYPNYIVFYQREEGKLIVRRVLHGARNLDALFAERDE